MLLPSPAQDVRRKAATQCGLSSCRTLAASGVASRSSVCKLHYSVCRWHSHAWIRAVLAILAQDILCKLVWELQQDRMEQTTNTW